jgi:hypothetical protein
MLVSSDSRSILYNSARFLFTYHVKHKSENPYQIEIKSAIYTNLMLHRAVVRRPGFSVRGRQNFVTSSAEMDLELTEIQNIVFSRSLSFNFKNCAKQHN